jgi:hypothetical protein
VVGVGIAPTYPGFSSTANEAIESVAAPSAMREQGTPRERRKSRADGSRNDERNTLFRFAKSDETGGSERDARAGNLL